jgi:hypothetical protein
MSGFRIPGTVTRLALGVALAVLMTGETMADETAAAKLQTLEQALVAQEREMAEQRERLAAQEELLARQRRDIEILRREILMQSRAGSAAGITDDAGGAPPAGGNSVATTRVSEAETGQQPASGSGSKPVGKPPPPASKSVRAPAVRAAKEVGGVLTEKGTLVIEPQFQYSTAQVNAFTFEGVQILDTFLLGLIEAQDNDRNFYSPALKLSYGLTNRLQASLKIPYVYRDDTLRATIPQVNTGEGQPVSLESNLKGNGLGDIEAAVSYQLNGGLNGWPYFLSNLRYKSTTGVGPFDVDRNSDGIETELPTGSGFTALEPSLTMLYPSAPAVFFANLGYLFNLNDNVNKTFGQQTVGKVDPGNATRISFGMGLSLNPRTSFTIGYKEDFMQKTTTEINGVNFSSSKLNVGALLLGYNFNLNKKTQVNLNLELGVTSDAPDATLTLSVPYSYHLF